MSEQRGEGSTVSTVIVLLLLLGGLVLLGLLVVVGLGFIVSQTTVERVMVAEQEEAVRQRDMAQLQMQRAMMAEQDRLRQMQEDGATLPGQPAQPVQIDQLAKAREVADKYVDFWRSKKLAEAGDLLLPELRALEGGPAGMPLANVTPPMKPAVLTSLRASAKQYRFRYHAETPELEMADFVITVVPQDDGFRIKAIDFDGAAGMPGMPNP